MKIKILEEAEQDLINGFRFYEAHNFGLGQYFLGFTVFGYRLFAAVRRHSSILPLKRGF